MATLTLQNFLSNLSKHSNMKFKTFNSIKTVCYKFLDNSSRGMATVKKRKKDKVLTKYTINPQFVKLQFAVIGQTVLRAMKHKEELEKGKRKPFSELIFTNQGDAHAMGQPALTFLRQVLVTCVYPELCKYSTIPDDVKKRAQIILNGCGGNTVGAYTDSQGLMIVREHIAEYIKKRDYGIPCNPNNLFVTDGASSAIRMVLSLFRKKSNERPTGVMIPIPQYPLYSATLTEFKLHPVHYYLNEDKNWALEIEELKRAFKECKCACQPKAIVVINPGNPTGQVLTKKNIEDVIKFAYEENLVILADEVCQENIYDEVDDFHSFKKVKHELGPQYNNVELASFMSISKGYTGECGLRGGFVELDGIDKDVLAMAVKSVSVMLCSNTIGQAALSVVCKPPEPGDPSYDEFMREKCCILNGLASKAKLVENKINQIKGLKTNPVQGSLYSMIKIDLPGAAIQEAKRRNIEPDVMWCNNLLDSTGVVVVPGSGFGQKPGTYHFRTTILPPFKTMEKMLTKVRLFNDSYLKKFK